MERNIRKTLFRIIKKNTYGRSVTENNKRESVDNDKKPSQEQRRK